MMKKKLHKSNFGSKFSNKSIENLKIIYKYMINIAIIYDEIDIKLYNKKRYKRHSVYYSAIRIGEAANQLKKEMTLNKMYEIIPGIPWQDIIEIRHNLAHTYNDDSGRDANTSVKIWVYNVYKHIHSYLKEISKVIGIPYIFRDKNFDIQKWIKDSNI